MPINRKCGLACVTNYLSARYTLMGFGPTQRGPTLVSHQGFPKNSMQVGGHYHLIYH